MELVAGVDHEPRAVSRARADRGAGGDLDAGALGCSTALVGRQELRIGGDAGSRAPANHPLGGGGAAGELAGAVLAVLALDRG